MFELHLTSTHQGNGRDRKYYLLELPSDVELDNSVFGVDAELAMKEKLLESEMRDEYGDDVVIIGCTIRWKIAERGHHDLQPTVRKPSIGKLLSNRKKKY